VNFEGLVGDEHHRDVAFRRGAVDHRFSLGKPDELARRVAAGAGDQRALQYVHAVRAGMRVGRIQNSGGITHQADLHSGIGVGVEVLAEDGVTGRGDGALFPGLVGGIDDVRHETDCIGINLVRGSADSTWR
jgi:hypothetical protein